MRHSEEDEIAGSEIRKAVRFSRLLLLSVLFLSTVVVAITVYLYTSHAEQRAFEDQFEEESLKVLESIGTSLDYTLGAVDSFVVNEVSVAKALNWTWPFVTIPDFAVGASKLRGLTRATIVGQYPLVTDATRYKWENYSMANEWWVDEVLEVQRNDETFLGTNVEEWSGWG